VGEDAAEARIRIGGRPMTGLEVDDRADARRLDPADHAAAARVRPSVPRPQAPADGELAGEEVLRRHVEVRAEERDDPVLADRVEVHLVDDVEAFLDAGADRVGWIDARDVMW